MLEDLLFEGVCVRVGAALPHDSSLRYDVRVMVGWTCGRPYKILSGTVGTRTSPASLHTYLGVSQNYITPEAVGRGAKTSHGRQGRLEALLKDARSHLALLAEVRRHQTDDGAFDGRPEGLLNA